MNIENLKLKFYRNIENLDIKLNSNINIIIGNNAQGKTNILESIYTLALTKSHRISSDYNLIKKNQLFTKLTTKVKKMQGLEKYEIIITPENKILKKDDIEEKLISNYISNINVILFTPEDSELIKKSPINRRKMIDIELCQLYKNYTKNLNEYNKILKMRNEYLKIENDFNYEYFKILTKKFIDRLVIVMEYRKIFIEQINSNISKIYFKITREKGLKIQYDPNINIELEKEALLNYFSKNFQFELNNRMTMYGPHKDDFSLYLNDKDLKIYGSQGQNKTAVLALKLAEIDIFKKTTGEYPIVLLDDVFSELDINKQNKLILLIKSNIQYIITTTDLKKINVKNLKNIKIFKVKDGIVTERNLKNGTRKKL